MTFPKERGEAVLFFKEFIVLYYLYLGSKNYLGVW